MEFTHAVVSTLHGEVGVFVRMFQSEDAAIEWACDYVRQNWPEDRKLMAMPNGQDFVDAFERSCDSTEWFFVQKVVFHAE